MTGGPAGTGLAWAALCPGQLSEKIGMGQLLDAERPSARAWFDEASDRTGVDLRATFFDGGRPDYRTDRPAQVGVYAVSVAVLDALEERGIRPAAAAGYSLGTYAACYAAGALTREDGLAVLLEVLRLLEERPVEGGMGFVVGLGKDEVDVLVREVHQEVGDLYVANENAARQVVVSGAREAVEAFVDRAGKTALKAGVLPMTVPMHTPFLEDHSDALAEFVRTRVTVRAPSRCALFAPMVGRALADEKETAIVLANQISVRADWAGTLRSIAATGTKLFVETGPGDVLAKMLRWTVRDGTALVAEDPPSILTVTARVCPVPAGVDEGSPP